MRAYTYIFSDVACCEVWVEKKASQQKVKKHEQPDQLIATVMLG